MAKDRFYRNGDEPTVDTNTTPEEVPETTGEKEETVDSEKPITGTVVGCSRLNIRKEPRPDAEVVCEVPSNSTLVIEPSESTNLWYKVFNEFGANGYCMTQYVSINE